MNLFSDYSLLVLNFRKLSGDEPDRLKAASDIRGLVELAARELSLERFENFERDLYQRIHNLVLTDNNGTSSNDAKIGGILLLKELIDCTSASAEAKIIKFANILSEALKNNSDFVILELIADGFGSMARYSVVSHLDCIESELSNAFEWMSSSIVHQRFAACVVLQQLAENAPTLLFAKIKEFFDLIWDPLWDSKERIRFAASRALSSCLSVLVHRTYHLEWYFWIYDQIFEGFRRGTTECVHGSLLVVSELLRHTGDFMIPRFKEISGAIMNFKDHKSKSIKSAIINLLPLFGSYCPSAFSTSHLNDSLDFLLKCLKTPELRADALLATGKLCRSLGSHLVPRVEELVIIVRDALQSGGKRYKSGTDVSSEALRCVSDMVYGLGSPFHNHILTLLEPMLQSGLTPELIETLRVVAEHIPNQKSVIQQRLFEEATKILGGDAQLKISEPSYLYSWGRHGSRVGHISKLKSCGVNEAVSSMSLVPASVSLRPVSPAPQLLRPASQILRPTSGLSQASNKSASVMGIMRSMSPSPAKPPKRNSSFSFMAGFRTSKSTPNISTSSSQQAASEESFSSDLVILALKTIGSLISPSWSLLQLLHSSVAPYLNSDHKDIRREAALTCVNMIASSPYPTVDQNNSSNAIEDIVSRLIEMVIADPSAEVRLSLLRCFPERFDLFLCRQHHIDSLTFLLADESFDIKLEALKMLGRLCSANPAIALPHLRQFLIRLISELHRSSDNRLKEEAALLICDFMKAMAFQPVVKAYLGTLIRSLPLENRSDVRLTCASLQAVGEVCLVMREETLPYIDHLLSVVIENVRDSSTSIKQEIALKTLGKLVSATGQVVRPYLKYPQLLPWILDLLFKNSAKTSWSLRREALRTLGLTGALEPRKYSMIIAHLESIEKKKYEKSDEKVAETPVHSLQTINNEPKIFSTSLRIKERSDSVTNGLASGNENDNKEGNTANDLATSSSAQAEKLIQSEVLLDEDNADRPAYLFMYEQSAFRSLSEPTTTEPPRLLPSSEEYYPQVCIAALMKILKDNTLSVHHSSAAQAIVLILRSLSNKCVGYLDSVVPYMLKMVRRSGAGLQESLLQQISLIIGIAGYHIVPYLGLIFETICDYWADHLEQVLILIQEISTAVSEAFATYMHQLLPLLLSSLTLPSSLITIATAAALPPEFGSSGKNAQQQQLAQIQGKTLKSLEQTLRCCNVIRLLLRPHISVVVPTLCKVIEQLTELANILDGYKWLILAIKTLRHVTTTARGSVIEQTNIVVTRIVHTLTSTMFTISESSTTSSALATNVINECIETIVAIGRQLGPRFIAFDVLVLKAIDSVILNANAPPTGRGSNLQSVDFGSYMLLSSDLRNGRLSDFGYGDLIDYFGGNSNTQQYNDEVGEFEYGFRARTGVISNTNMSKYVMNQPQLAKAWDVSQRSTASDWNEWLRRLKVDLIRESPSPIVRACAAISQSYPPLAHDLLHAAFVSCWQELSEIYQESLVRSLLAVFRNSSIPPEILQTLLNLAEFMEHDVEALPIQLSILAELAQKSRAYAKALHYRELEFQLNPEGCFESLININKKLNQYDAAVGVVKVIKKMQKQYPALKDSFVIQDAWMAKLGYWDEALEQYDIRLTTNPNDSVAIAGKLKCLEALGRWEEAIHICKNSLDMLKVASEKSPTDSSQSNIHTKAAVIGARAAWSLSEWNLMDRFVSSLSDANVDGSFLKAVLATHRGDFSSSEMLLDKTRVLLDESISALLSESYGRAYHLLILVQQCSELEEIVEYKKLVQYSRDLDEQLNEQVAPRHIKGPQYYRHVPSCRPVQTMSSLTSIVDSGDDTKIEQSLRSPTPVQIQVLNHKTQLAEKWRRRLLGCNSSGKAAIPLWKYLLNGHRLVLKESEDLDTWLEFASLCRNTGNVKLSERILQMSRGMVSENLNPSTQALIGFKIDFAFVKQLWTTGERVKALQGLENLSRSIGNQQPFYEGLNVSNMGAVASEIAAVQLNCKLKLGQWKLAMVEPGAPVDAATRREVQQLYHQATIVDPSSYSAWHQWGLSNYRFIEEIRGKTGRFVSQRPFIGTLLGARSPAPQSRGKVPFDILLPLVVNALKGLLRAISLGTRRWSSSVTQDMLCVLTLWFKYGKVQEVYGVLESGLSMCHVDNWLGVLPQLIARIDHPETLPRQLLHSLLQQLGTRHAEALVFPLSLAIKAPKQERIQAAEALMSSLRQHSPRVIEQALMVSRELVRVAIVWEEQWHESLEEASRLYFSEGNVAGMIDTLSPLYEALEAGPQTLFENAFCQQFARELLLAWSDVKKYLNILAANGKPVPTSGVAHVRKSREDVSTPEAAYLHTAWEQYYQSFQNINKRLSGISSLELQSCSPALLAARDFDVGVPGTYTVSGSSVRIKGFEATVAIIKSKQRPRKIRMYGEDGRSFLFLLKGHEDLRQDERAMQLFGLVNALLVHDKRTNHESHNLTIERYAVIPLSPTAGLISWVPNCDTLHDLLREYRDTRRIIFNVEHKLMQQLSPPTIAGYDILTHPQKLEIFEYALHETTGEDLAKILWLKSDTSEAWLQRRLNYTRSLAVMSMVGYILGLGDRHPSNLMLNRGSGKVLHIDFGDSFEIAINRDKFPEKVPFRLTRMLVNAMEVSGIEGNFRLTCEKVMSVLRENRDSLVAILEAFVYDPLISWRLLSSKTHRIERIDTSQESSSHSKDRRDSIPQSPKDKGSQPSTEVNPEVYSSPDMPLSYKNLATVKSYDKLDEESSSSRLETIEEINEELSTSPMPGLPDEDQRVDRLSSQLTESGPVRRLSQRDTVAVLDPFIDGSNEPRVPVFHDLHIAISNLAQSLHQSPSSRAASSVARHSLRQMSIAQRSSLRRGVELGDDEQDDISSKAVAVIRRVVDKLTGLDFTNAANASALDVPEQVDRLIKEATANENLCRSFVGWCAFW